MLLGYDYWRTRFGGDPHVVGKTVRFVDGVATVAGVTPDHFYPRTAIGLATGSPPIGRVTRTDTIARLRTGVSLDQAARELSAIINRAAPERGEPANITALLTSRRAEVSAGYGQTVTTLAAAVGFILLIACVNVSGLLLARGATRRPELAIRASIGAGRTRLIRQLLTESLVLAFAGCAVGALFAWLALDALVAIIPMTLPATASAAINVPVLTFALALSSGTALVFGLVPALRLSRVQLSAGFGGGARRHGSALSRRGGQLLIGVEVALAVVLLAGAGLMVRSFARVMAVDVGFDPSAILTMEVAPVEQTPAVMTAVLPGAPRNDQPHPRRRSGGRRRRPADVQGRPRARLDRRFRGILVRRQQGSARYVDAMGLRLKEGAHSIGLRGGRRAAGRSRQPDARNGHHQRAAGQRTVPRRRRRRA